MKFGIGNLTIKRIDVKEKMSTAYSEEPVNFLERSSSTEILSKELTNR